MIILNFFIPSADEVNAQDLDYSKIAHQLYALGYHPFEYHRWHLRIPVVRMMYGLAKLRFPEMARDYEIDWSLVLRTAFEFVCWQLRTLFAKTFKTRK